jgi:hypothetical protein
MKDVRYRPKLRQLPGLLLAALTVAAMAAEDPAPVPSPTFVMIPMRDGVQLATDIYLPATGAPCPVVLARSVYGREFGPQWGPPWLDKGIAFAVQDCRGRGGSEGTDLGFYADGWGEAGDGADTVAWLRAQPWCNGKIATFGGSALGIVQILAAPATPWITCQGIIVAPGSLYGNVTYQGGVFRKEMMEGWLEIQKLPHVLELWKEHPGYDAFWRHFDAVSAADRTTAPAVHVGGWWDCFGQGTLEAFMSRQEEGALPGRGNQKLIMGPWLHGLRRELGDVTLAENFDAVDFNQYIQRFFRYWLLDEQNGIMEEPAVQYYTVGDLSDPNAPGNEWRTASSWPPFPTRATPYYLNPDGMLQAEQVSERTGGLTFSYDPADPVPSLGGATLLHKPGVYDQRPVSGRADVLKFATPPLAEPLEITGRVKVRLYVCTDARDTDFTAKLVDIYPDGREILMLDGIQHLKFRNGFEMPDYLLPGEIAEVEIDLWSISLIFNAGHRIGLHVSSSNFPRFERNPNTGKDFPAEDEPLAVASNTVFMGVRYPSALILPIAP